MGEVTNEDLLREIDELKGWVLFLLSREEEKWIKGLNEPSDEESDRQRFRKQIRDYRDYWVGRGHRRRKQPLRTPDDEGPLPPNVIPFRL